MPRILPADPVITTLLEWHRDRVANFPPPANRPLIEHDRPRIAVAIDDHHQLALCPRRQFARFNERECIATRLRYANMLLADDKKRFNRSRVTVLVLNPHE